MKISLAVSIAAWLPLTAAGVQCTAPGESPAARESCALAAVAQACASDPARVSEAIAEALGVPRLQVRRGVGRQLLGSMERGDLCDRDDAERKRIIAAAWQPKRAPSEAASNWLRSTLLGPDGKVDALAMSLAFEQREDMLATGLAKRAGLPVAPPIGAWTNLTGYTQSPGRINTIVFTSNTGNDIIAGADGGGMWRTANGGASWTFVNDFFGSLSISSFGRTVASASTLYAGTNPQGSHTYYPFGILKSTDTGATWTQLVATSPGVNADFTHVQRVAVHPASASIVLAATDGGGYQSVDGGATWTKMGPAVAAYDVGIHPVDGNRRFIAYNDGTIRYTTTGDLQGAGALTATIYSGGRYPKVSYAKSDVNRLYALVTDSAGGATHVRMSNDGGGSWTEASQPAGEFYNSSYLHYTGALWVDPFNANRVALCEGWAHFTADISQVTPIWKNIAGGWTDFHGIVAHPGYDGTTNRTVFFMDDGGLYRISDVDALDNSANLTRIESGMTVTQLYSLSGYRGNPIFGAQDVGPKAYKTAAGDSNALWRLIGNPATGGNWIGDGMTTAASRANPNVLYGSRQYLDMFRSTDGGLTATSIVAGSALTEGRGAGNFNAGFVAPFVLDPSNQSRMLAGALSLWRTNNADTGNPPTWQSIKAPITDTACGTYQPPIGTIAVAPSNPDVVWVIHAGCLWKVFKSVNATQASPTFTEVALPGAMATTKMSIMIDRDNPNIVWIGLGSFTSSTLFRATDGGVGAGSWTAVPGLPGAPVYSLTQHPANPRWVYAGTSLGLFASVDGGATWSPSNEGPANVVVRSLSWNTTGTVSQLLVGTFGRGAWRVPVSMANMDFSGDARSDVLYRNATTGQVYRLFANGPTLSGGAIAYTEPNPAWKVVADGDFNGDGVTDLLWRNTTTGQVYVMPFNASGMPATGAVVHTEANPAWKIVATPDIDGDGRNDLLWWNSTTGQVYVMLLNGAAVAAQGMAYTEPNTSWSIVATGDFAGSGKRNQLLWRHASTGQVYLQTLTYSGGAFSQSGAMIYQEPNTAWRILGAPDLNGDGRSDILWRNDTTGQVYGMTMNGGVIATQAMIYTEPSAAWKIVAHGDYNGDGRADLLWRNETTGQVFMMLTGPTGLAIQSQAMVYNEPNIAWKVLGPYEYAQ